MRRSQHPSALISTLNTKVPVPYLYRSLPGWPLTLIKQDSYIWNKCSSYSDGTGTIRIQNAHLMLVLTRYGTVWGWCGLQLSKFTCCMFRSLIVLNLIFRTLDMVQDTGPVQGFCFKTYVLLWNFATVSEQRRVGGWELVSYMLAFFEN
jgi:hypothetical protein